MKDQLIALQEYLEHDDQDIRIAAHELLCRLCESDMKKTVRLPLYSNVLPFTLTKQRLST